MKRKLPVLIMSMLIAASITAQINPYNGIHDLDSCHFEAPCNWIVLSNDTNNIWQIGPPQKPFFDTAYSPANALVTDTIHPYASSTSSYFDIPMSFNFYYNPILSFKHKYQTDSLIDGCYIEISYDNGATWKNVIRDTLNPPFVFNSENLYALSDTLQGGINGFSGSSNGWITTRLQWVWNIPVKPAESGTIIRFHFISDGLQTNKAGWMIDDILLSYADMPGGISEFQNSGLKIKLAPNPADQFINLSFEQDDSRSYSLSVFNILGQEVKTIQDIHAGQARLDISDFKNGMYFVQLKKAGQTLGSGKFIKR